jgi:hypothetical protein
VVRHNEWEESKLADAWRGAFHTALMRMRRSRTEYWNLFEFLFGQVIHSRRFEIEF